MNMGRVGGRYRGNVPKQARAWLANWQMRGGWKRLLGHIGLLGILFRDLYPSTPHTHIPRNRRTQKQTGIL